MHERAVLLKEGGKPVALLPAFSFRAAGRRETMDLLLVSFEHSGYTTRLFFERKIRASSAWCEARENAVHAVADRTSGPSRHNLWTRTSSGGPLHLGPARSTVASKRSARSGRPRRPAASNERGVAKALPERRLVGRASRSALTVLYDQPAGAARWRNQVPSPGPYPRPRRDQCLSSTALHSLRCLS